MSGFWLDVGDLSRRHVCKWVEPIAGWYCWTVAIHISAGRWRHWPRWGKVAHCLYQFCEFLIVVLHSGDLLTKSVVFWFQALDVIFLGGIVIFVHVQGKNKVCDLCLHVYNCSRDVSAVLTGPNSYVFRVLTDTVIVVPAHAKGTSDHVLGSFPTYTTTGFTLCGRLWLGWWFMFALPVGEFLIFGGNFIRNRFGSRLSGYVRVGATVIPGIGKIRGWGIRGCWHDTGWMQQGHMLYISQWQCQPQIQALAGRCYLHGEKGT